MIYEVFRIGKQCCGYRFPGPCLAICENAGAALRKDVVQVSAPCPEVYENPNAQKAMFVVPVSGTNLEFPDACLEIYENNGCLVPASVSTNILKC